MRIRGLRIEDAPACDTIIASLPDWFGLDEGIRECAHAVRTQPGLVGERDGRVLGFLTIERPSDRAAEISWLAVHRDARGRRIGTGLVEHLVSDLRAEATVRLLVV